MTEAEYSEKMARIAKLMESDPAPETPEGIELDALVDEVHTYEKTHFPMRTLIEDFRGGVPKKCDFCGKEVPPESLEPWEAGDWACRACAAQEYDAAGGNQELDEPTD